MGMFQTMTSAFVDEYAWVKDRKVMVTGALCFAEFIIGIPCVTQGGIYVLQVLDWYSSTFSLMIIAFTECVIIGWIYGVEQFYKDITMMIGYRPCAWWRILWCYITPGLILFVLLFSIVIHTPVTYGEYVYPSWAIAIGWLFALCSIIPLPSMALYKVWNEKGSIRKRISKLLKPVEQWGPALEQYRELYKASIYHVSSSTSFPELESSQKLNGCDASLDPSVV
ncbi:hypothetical protein NP493_325g02070 [Ridgeia piscesae]|uniref:Uncharacterized protein n=1 Tax=Ridgeia piscesae TaxID=27915 RepID=A0AAD9NUN8_RIDPI|nr:hypothetical protein NP493_325g02070 [Ridgeia piscesae]